MDQAKNARALKRITKELEQLQGAQALPFAKVELKEKTELLIWKVTLQGPAGSPYEKGAFVTEIDLRGGYPFKHPAVLFTTKVGVCCVVYCLSTRFSSLPAARAHTDLPPQREPRDGRDLRGVAGQELEPGDADEGGAEQGVHHAGHAGRGRAGRRGDHAHVQGEPEEVQG